MATRAEVVEKLKTAASEGNIRETYREFEELPIVDQLAISISPGVGDALAVYEVGEFAKRGSESLEEDSFLGALGNFGFSALAAASLIPIFRLLRGARTIKTVPKTEAKLLENLEPTKVVEETTKDLPVPKVEEFKPLSLDEQMYPGTIFDNKRRGRPAGDMIVFTDPDLLDQGLTSKAARFVNTSKKLPNQGKAQAFINQIKQSGVPEGELRLLNLIDETGEIHPKLMSELEIRNPQGRITRQRLANYIKSNQQGALSRRRVNINQSDSYVDAPGISGIKENTYHIKGLDRKENFAHYSNLDEHKDNFVFDSIADLDLRAASDLRNPDRVAEIQNFIGGDNLLNVARIQSDYAEEVARLQQTYVSEKLQYIRGSDVFDDIKRKFLTSDEIIGVEQDMLKVVRQFPNIKTGKELKEKFLEQMADEGSQVYKSLIAKKGNSGAREFSRNVLKKKRSFKKEDFEKLLLVVEEANLRYPVTPYVDAKKLAVLKKGLNEYNQNVPKVNKLAQNKFKLQNELKESGLTPDSPSYLKISDELAEIDKQIADLVPANSFGNFSEFTLTKADLEQATGKPFTESLGKSIDEIFYDLERIGGGDAGPIRQKYGPGTPEERALNYFNKMVNNSDQTFDLANGLGILKRATKINPDLLKGYAIDPYAKGARTNATKLPIRSNFLRAVTEGKDGMYLDSAAKRLGKEGGSEEEILKFTYREAEDEIAKIIKELGEDPKKYVKQFLRDPSHTPTATDALDGTYVKIDDQIRELVKNKGIDAFKDGGPVTVTDPEVSSEPYESLVQLIEQLSEHNIKVVDFDEDEDSIKNRLFALAGETPSGHINPSSWLNPSGELTIYVPKAVKRSPELYKRFLIEEVKHVDQIREAPFKTGVMSLLGIGKQRLSEVPGNLLNKLPDFHTYEDELKYFEDSFDPDWETKRGPHPSWKERSGIAQLFRDIRYNSYKDPHSVEGIHRNEERYLPVLEKYGVDKFLGPNTYAKGGPIDALGSLGALGSRVGRTLSVPLSNREKEKIARAKKKDIERQFEDVVGKRFYKDYVKDTEFENLGKIYKNYPEALKKKRSDLKKKRSDLEKEIKEEVLENLPFKSDVIESLRNTTKQIYKSNDPRREARAIFKGYSSREIDDALQNLNLPLDVRKTTEGTEFSKDIYSGDQFNIDFTGYRPDSGNFKGDVLFEYADRTPYGDIDIKSILNELGDIKTYADYQYEKGPLGIRGTKNPGRDFYGDIKLKYDDQTPYGDVSIESMIDEMGDIKTYGDYKYQDGPFNLNVEKRPGRDFYGDASYTLDNIDLGNNQTLTARAIVDTLKNAELRLNYNYQNPSTGGYFRGGVDLGYQANPELLFEFGREF